MKHLNTRPLTFNIYIFPRQTLTTSSSSIAINKPKILSHLLLIFQNHNENQKPHTQNKAAQTIKNCSPLTSNHCTRVIFKRTVGYSCCLWNICKQQKKERFFFKEIIFNFHQKDKSCCSHEC